MKIEQEVQKEGNGFASIFMISSGRNLARKANEKRETIFWITDLRYHYKTKNKKPSSQTVSYFLYQIFVIQ